MKPREKTESVMIIKKVCGDVMYRRLIKIVSNSRLCCAQAICALWPLWFRLRHALLFLPHTSAFRSIMVDLLVQLPDVVVPGAAHEMRNTSADEHLQVQSRLQFLWRAARIKLLSQPELSRLYSREMVRVQGAALVDTGEAVEELLCLQCGCTLLPGKTARVRVRHRSRRSATNSRKRRQKREGCSAGLKNELVWTCLLCGAIRSKDGVARTIEAQQKAKLHLGPQGVSRSRKTPEAESGRRISSAAVSDVVTNPQDDFISLHQPQKRKAALPLDCKPRKKAPAPPSTQESKGLGELRSFISSLKRMR